MWPVLDVKLLSQPHTLGGPFDVERGFPRLHRYHAASGIQMAGAVSVVSAPPTVPPMRWFPWRRSDRPAPAPEPPPPSPEAVRILDQLVDHHHDGPPTAIGWSLRHEGPPWEALEELRRLGYCEVTRDQDMVEVDFTELGRRLYV